MGSVAVVTSLRTNFENGGYKAHDEDIFGPDYSCDFLIDFMDRAARQERPFFAYFPMNLIHDPLITPPGNQKSAEARYPKDLGQRERNVGQMVHYMDGIVGRLLSKLEQLEVDQETLVIFTGDNGTAGKSGVEVGRLSSPRGQTYDERSRHTSSLHREVARQDSAWTTRCIHHSDGHAAHSRRSSQYPRRT